MAELVKFGEPSTRKEGSIPLYLVGGVATVWDAQTAATLHCVHSISGLRAGTLPGVTQQNGFLGLPVTLMQEETAYLLQQGIAHLVPLNPNPSPPDEATVKAHTAARIARIQAWEKKASELEAQRQEENKKAFDKGGEKARIKREARAKAKAEKAKTSEEGSGLLDGETVGEVNVVVAPTDKPVKKEKPSQPPPTHFHIVPSHPVVAPAAPDTPSVLSPAAITSLPHPLFPFPSSPRDHALVGVFTTLQSLGHRVGLGPRFGGEWLVYPGDYLRYHAHFTSQVIVRNEPIKPTELVAWGRLGTGTKKAGLICCWDDGVRGQESVDESGEKEPEVEFYSLEWANFG